jgi:hypothetical protein
MVLVRLLNDGVQMEELVLLMGVEAGPGRLAGYGR